MIPMNEQVKSLAGIAEHLQAVTEMPRYKCHKKVWALKIASVSHDEAHAGQVGESGGTIVPAESGYAAFSVSSDYMERHKPQTGGYYVQYADGYISYSPAKAFEEGYSPTKEEVAA